MRILGIAVVGVACLLVLAGGSPVRAQESEKIPWESRTVPEKAADECPAPELGEFFWDFIANDAVMGALPEGRWDGLTQRRQTLVIAKRCPRALNAYSNFKEAKQAADAASESFQQDNDAQAARNALQQADQAVTAVEQDFGQDSRFAQEMRESRDKLKGSIAAASDQTQVQAGGAKAQQLIQLPSSPGQNSAIPKDQYGLPAQDQGSAVGQGQSNAGTMTDSENTEQTHNADADDGNVPAPARDNSNSVGPSMKAFFGSLHQAFGKTDNSGN